MSQLQTGANPASPVLLLSAPCAAKALSICVKTLWSMTEPRSDLPVVRIGRRVLYDPRDLTAWIDAQKKGGADR